MKDKFNTTGRGDVPEKGNLRSSSYRNVDFRKYMSFLDETEMSDAQKLEYLEGVWLFVDIFVTHSFGIHPVQEVCGKVAANSPEAPKIVFNRVSLEDYETKRELKSQKPEA